MKKVLSIVAVAALATLYSCGGSTEATANEADSTVVAPAEEVAAPVEEASATEAPATPAEAPAQDRPLTS